MRVCLYTDTALPKLGGQEAVVDALARQFQQFGADVKVLAPQPRFFRTVSNDHHPYPMVRHPRFLSTHAFVAWYRRWLRRLSRAWPFDVLHCHGVYPPGYLAALLRPAMHVPVVITSHGGDIYPNNVRLARPVVRSRVEESLRSADALIAISRFTDENYRRLCPGVQTIVSIPNGVDLGPFVQAAPRPAGLDDAIRPGEYLVFLGRLASRKGVDVLLPALAMLPESSRVRLVIAGDGPQRADLERQCARLGLGQQVRFVGAIFDAAKTYLLQNSLCMVIPSRTWEAFPLVVLESYAAGKPVVATRIPGLEDLITPGSTGWLVPENDPRALAQVLGKVLDQRAEVARLGAQARQIAQQFSWPAVAQLHLRLFRDLLATRRVQAA